MNHYRITEDLEVYFVTFTIIDWVPIFTQEKPAQILIESLLFCIENKGLRINAYVIMPSHLHAIVFDANGDSQNLRATLTHFRKFSGRQLAKFLYSGETVNKTNSKRSDRSRQVWQPSWHAEAIYSESFWLQKLAYIHQNPCRKGLVESPQDWVYSSAGYWLEGKPGIIPITDFNQMQ